MPKTHYGRYWDYHRTPYRVIDARQRMARENQRQNLLNEEASRLRSEAKKERYLEQLSYNANLENGYFQRNSYPQFSGSSYKYNTKGLANEEIKSIKNPVAPKGTEKQETTNRDNKLKMWKTSMAGLSIGARALFAYGSLYYVDKMSTDRTKTKIDMFRGAESAISVGLSLIPGAGPALAGIWAFASQVVGRHITNDIQRRGDTKRIAYNFANYDLGKYGTYAYDNTSQDWVAQDANKVKARTLGQKQSV